MCCWTHDERDKYDDTLGVEYARADSQHLRCICKYGNSCAREQSGPDLLCDWCRSRNHERECEEIGHRINTSDRTRAILEREITRYRRLGA